jgi:hypothetical protein
MMGSPRPQTPRIWLAVIGLVFTTATLWRASVKLLWYDELYTFYIAQKGSPAKIWTALMSGVDLNPPLLYVFTRAGQLIAGDNELGTRLPAIAGFSLMMISLYLIVALRFTTPYALQAMLFPAVSGAYLYAYEARSYGVVLGCAAFAMLCWQRAACRTTRGQYLAGLTLAILTGLLTHCYAVMILPPIALGELVRTVRSRRIDWSVWLSMCAPCVAITIYLPLLRSSHGLALKGPIFDPNPWKLFHAYFQLLWPAIVPLAATFLILVLIAKVPRRKRALTTASDPCASASDMRDCTRLPLHELAAAVGFLLVPAAAYIIALAMGGGYFERYGLTAIIGFSLVLPCACFVLLGPDFRRAYAFPALLLFWFTLVFAVHSPSRPALLPPELAEWKRSLDIPLVAADGQAFLQLDHYLDDAATSHLYFLTDRPTALRTIKTDCYDTAMPMLKRIFPIRSRISGYSEFIASHPHFLIYGTAGPAHEWIEQKLREDGISTARISPGRFLLEVNAARASRIP